MVLRKRSLQSLRAKVTLSCACWHRISQQSYESYIILRDRIVVDLVIVIRGDWLWKAANINDKNNSAAVYVQSTVKVHNPLFSVGKLLRNVFIGQYNQNDRNSFERCALSGPQKHITKESDGFHNHSTQLTMTWSKISTKVCGFPFGSISFHVISKRIKEILTQKHQYIAKCLSPFNNKSAFKK